MNGAPAKTPLDPKAFRDAFSKVSRLLEPLSQRDQVRVVRAVAILLDMPIITEPDVDDREPAGPGR